MNDLQALFISQLGSVYDAEEQLADAFSGLEKEARLPDVKRAVGEQRQAIGPSIARLHEAFQSVGESPKTRRGHGIRGIIEEGRALAAELEGHAAIDIALLSLSHKVQHFKITSYGTLCTWAKALGLDGAVGPLKLCIGEAKRTEAQLTDLGVSVWRAESSDDRDLRRLLVRQMRQLLDGENLLVTALAEVQYYAVSKLLKLAVHLHWSQTKKHVKRLEQGIATLGETVDRRPCDGLEGIIDDAQVDVLEFLHNSALDAALIASAQKAEHYEISAYGNLSRWADHLGCEKLFALLDKTLAEEVSTDKKLTLLAELLRNRAARLQSSGKASPGEAEVLKLATHGG